jgi:hypothetical protein
MGFLAPVLGAVTAVGSLFGGGDKPAKQENVAYKQLNETYTPQTRTGVGANNFMAGLLGVGGGGTPEDSFEKYKSMAGYAPALEALQKGVTQGAAAKGLLNSGSTQKALVRYGAGLDQQMFNNYFQSLNALNSQGLNAGQLIGGAGNTNTGAQAGLTTQIGNAVGAIPGLTKGFQGIASIFN